MHVFFNYFFMKQYNSLSNTIQALLRFEVTCLYISSASLQSIFSNMVNTFFCYDVLLSS